MRTARIISAAVLVAGALLLLSGCYKTEYSPETAEPGRVEQMLYAPGGTASGTALTMKGDLAVTSTSIPDRYAIVFSCPHGKFTLKPEGETAKRIFSQLVQGDSVTIYYREEFHVREGEPRELVRLDFLDAVKRRPRRGDP